MAPLQHNPTDSCEGESSSLTGVRNPRESQSHFHSEKAFLEFEQNTEDHQIDFSEALRTVTKALRRAAESKAAAEAEAIEWKRRYEIARARNLKLEFNGESSVISDAYVDNNGLQNGETEDKKKCSENELSANQVLQEEIRNNAPKSPKVLSRKASFKLTWRSQGEKSDQHKNNLVSFDQGDIRTTERSSKQITLKWQSNPQSVLIITKPNSLPVRSVCFEMVRWLRNEKQLIVYVEPRVRNELLAESQYFDFVQTWNDDEEIMHLHSKVDLVITLGGDGTVLWAASMFNGPVPPIVAFALGSLGFMTPFYSENYADCLTSILKGPMNITLRHRLECYIVRDEDSEEEKNPFLVLNEVTIDRGISSFLTNLDCYCDKSFVTTVQGDGLILSTTSGSTAYSLAAGGSMVHPQVPGILFTPICPHSLSFRPVVFPEHVNIRVQVPYNSRSHAWVSFDGKNRQQLGCGDALICRMAPWPVPTACVADSTSDFLHTIQDCLHWNLRKSQSLDLPKL